MQEALKYSRPVDGFRLAYFEELDARSRRPPASGSKSPPLGIAPVPRETSSLPAR
jgi:hypothetical protein